MAAIFNSLAKSLQNFYNKDITHDQKLNTSKQEKILKTVGSTTQFAIGIFRAIAQYFIQRI
jgi:hypothetical protein